MKKIKRIVWVLFIMLAISIAGISLSNYIIIRQTKKHIYTDLHSLPINDIGLVLGTSKYTKGGINQYYSFRIEAAAELYKTGKVKHLIVSGDNHKHGYNEPEQMKESLIKAGVPADKITCDYAGYRTFDSVVRLKKVFQTSKVTIISQKFHLERALFIADHYQIEAVGYCSKDVGKTYNRRSTGFREWLAKSKAMLDLYLLGTQPRHLGPVIHINI